VPSTPSLHVLQPLQAVQVPHAAPLTDRKQNA
jgi:hypothetical protein